LPATPPPTMRMEGDGIVVDVMVVIIWDYDNL
jgi:hypothetical protein